MKQVDLSAFPKNELPHSLLSSLSKIFEAHQQKRQGKEALAYISDFRESQESFHVVYKAEYGVQN